MPRRKRDTLPQDENAERSVLGAMLQGYDDESLDPQHFAHEGRRAIFLALVNLRGNGALVTPASYDDPRAVDAAARENANRVASAVQRVGEWKAVDGPEHELRDSLNAVTQGALIHHYADILIERWKRRELLHAAEQLQRVASDESTDLADALAGIDLSELNNDAPRNGRLSPVVLRLADVRPEPVRWLWPGRIARGKLTLLAGDAGLGKSYLTLDLAARVTRGLDWPDRAPGDGPGGVVLLNAEDDPADTIRPRLDAAGADVTRIVMLSAVKYRDSETGVKCERSICLKTDLAALEQAIRDTPDCRLVVIDPITAYLSGVDSHKNAEMRAVLAPLSELARRYSVAAVPIDHLNKASGMSAMYRVMGSLATVAACRAAWLVARDPDDPRGPRRLMLSLKNNIAIDRSGLAFTLQSSLTVTGTAVIAWERDAVNVSADDALAPRDGRRDRASPVLDEAVEWLRTQLSGGPKPAKELQVAADADGIKSDAVRRAKRALGVAASRDGGFGAAGAWVWTLPSEGGDGDDAPDDDAPDGDVLDGDGAPLRPQVRLRRVRRPPF